MIVLGLTGSIGMGKSTIAKMFRKCGVPTHDADAAVHQLMQPDGKAFGAIAALFPSVIKNGQIDRKALGNIVFSDPDKKQALEAILHPMVRSLTDEFIRKSRFEGRKAALLEIPLLFETNGENRVDYVICVSAPAFVQKRRVLARPNMTEEKFNSILQSQLPDALKRCCSDFIINTAQNKAQCMRDVKKIIARVLKT